ncbi:DUF424 family protein [Candidatus Woesearchaeota archaeon]|nr:MAG: DUF424 family protein [Candidatus Woesearchaeota archaeon]
MRKIIVKKHTTDDGRVLLAMCDEDILGETFEEGEAVLDLASDFYKGEAVEEEERSSMAEDAYLINAAGKESVGWLIGKGFAEEENIITIQGVPNIQILIEK